MGANRAHRHSQFTVVSEEKIGRVMHVDIVRFTLQRAGGSNSSERTDSTNYAAAGRDAQIAVFVELGVFSTVGTDHPSLSTFTPQLLLSQQYSRYNSDLPLSSI